MVDKKKIGEERFIHTSIPYSGRRLLNNINGERLIINRNKSIWERLIYVVLALIVIYMFGPAIFIGRDGYRVFAEFIVAFITSLGATLFCIIVIINVIINTERIFVFNRLEGTITMRSSVLNWRPGTVTIPYSEAIIVFIGRAGHVMKIALPNSKFRHLVVLGTADSKDDVRCISFFTWYMDKNRPLPPGEDLDPYREADYLRRKAEGFPPPLYPSKIPTPDQDWYIPKEKKIEKR